MSGVGRLGRQLGLSGPPSGERAAPRIGAFEVSYKLVNTSSNRIYGPVHIFSKLETGHWPGSAARLQNKVQETLQQFLKGDMDDIKVYTYIQSEGRKGKEEAPKSPAGVAPASPIQVSTPALPPPSEAQPPAAATPLRGVALPPAGGVSGAADGDLDIEREDAADVEALEGVLSGH